MLYHKSRLGVVGHDVMIFLAIFTTNFSDDNKQNLLKELNNFQPGNSEVNPLRILLYGPVGAGKSSFINSVDSAIQGRIKNRALADSMTGNSFTLVVKAILHIKYSKYNPHCNHD